MTQSTPLARVVLVMGKGGVGKTTVAAGLATLNAQTHGRAVLIEFGDGESGRRALHGAPGGVEHVALREFEALQRAAGPLFGSTSVARLVLGNVAMKALLRAAPAIRELAMLESVRQIAAERPHTNIVVDMPATGHSIAWLRVPKQGRDFLKSGRLFDLCERVRTELVSRGRASVLVVTLPERLVIEETLDLCTAIANETALSVDRIVVNRMPVPLPSDAASAAASLNTSPAVAELLEVLHAREAANREAMAAVDGLTAQKHAVWRLDLAPVDPHVVKVAEWLRAAGAV